MNLIIDVGNTRVKAFLLDKELVVKESVFAGDEIAHIKQLIGTEKVQRVLVAASGTVDDDFHNYLVINYVTIFMDHHTKLPIVNHYKTPETLGRDRLAAMVGAFELYPGQASLVIDAGTCVTYDAIDQCGNYYGGSISPGLIMRCKAMHHFTARLPEIEPVDFDYEVGFDTVSSLLTGAVLGLSYEMEGFIRQYQRKFSVLNVILTGGDAEIVAKYLQSAFVINHRISLLGLNKILSYNV